METIVILGFVYNDHNTLFLYNKGTTLLLQNNRVLQPLAP